MLQPLQCAVEFFSISRLIIYYLLSITSSLRESNNDLMTQIRREKEDKRAKKEEEEGARVPEIPLDTETREGNLAKFKKKVKKLFGFCLKCLRKLVGFYLKMFQGIV